jgi:hypothetical protein
MFEVVFSFHYLIFQSLSIFVGRYIGVRCLDNFHQEEVQCQENGYPRV